MSVANLSEFQPVFESCTGVPKLISGMYSKHDSLEIAKICGIPSRFVFNLNTDFSTTMNKITVSKDQDRSKALLQVIKMYIDNQNKQGRDSGFSKDDGFRKLLPLIVLTDNKKEREKLAEGFFKLGLKVLNIGEEKSDQMALEEDSQSQKKSVLRLKNLISQAEDQENRVYLGSCARILESSELKFNLMVHNGFPKSHDWLIKNTMFNHARQHYFISDQAFVSRRNQLLLECLEPASLLKFCQMLKRLANIQTIKLTEKASPDFGSPMSIDSTAVKEQPVQLGSSIQEYSASKFSNPNRTPMKSSADCTMLRINKSTMLGVLSTNSSSVLSSIMAMLRAKNFFEVAATAPYQLRIEFLIPNHTKSNSEQVKQILQLSNFQSGKYILNLIDFALSSLTTIHPRELSSGKKKNALGPEKNLTILKTNKISLNSGIIKNGCETINQALGTLKNLKEQGIIDFEIDDELFFLRPKEGMSDVDVYSMIAERKNLEDAEIRNIDTMYSVMESNSLGTFEQFLKGIISSNSNLSLESYITQLYTSHKKDGDSLVAGLGPNVKLKTKFNQREKSSIVKDVIELIQKEKQYFQALIASMGKIGEGLKKRSIILHILKQIYSGSKLTKLKFLKTQGTFVASPNLKERKLLQKVFGV